ncbi:hypothetical protein ACLBWH_00720 [Sphingomonas sp. M6A6_1c]
MRRLLPFLACLMLVLTGWSGMVHAAETVTCMEMPHAMAGMHVADSCDQPANDARKGFPAHHAACHGHHVATPAIGDVRFERVLISPTFTRVALPDVPQRWTNRTLRPPQA